MITRKNLPLHELIGLRVTVAQSSCRNLIGARGTVVDETKNTLVVRGENGQERRIPKRACRFMFRIPSGEDVELEGSLLAHAPEERPKRLMRKL